MEGSTRKTTSLFGDMLSNAWKAEKVVAKTLHQLPIHVILMKVLYHTVHKNPAAVGRWAKNPTSHPQKKYLHVIGIARPFMFVFFAPFPSTSITESGDVFRNRGQ